MEERKTEVKKKTMFNIKICDFIHQRETIKQVCFENNGREDPDEHDPLMFYLQTIAKLAQGVICLRDKHVENYM